MKLKLLILFLLSSFTLYSAEDLSGYGGTVYFQCDFETGDGAIPYRGSGNAHAGGGYFANLGGNVTGPVAGGCDRTTYPPATYRHAIVRGGGAAAGAISGSDSSLQTYGSGNCTNESSSRDITRVAIPSTFSAGVDCYVRWYQKWTGAWNSSTVQHKFTKFNDAGEDVYGCHFSYAPGSNYWRNYMDNHDGQFNVGITRGASCWIYENEEGAGSQYPNVTRYWDDYNNELDGGSDGQFLFEVDTWYCLEVHFKLNSNASTADGVVEAWVNGVKVFGIENIKMYNSGTPVIDNFEMQHIYYERTNTDRTYMDNIVIGSSYIGLAEGDDITAPTGILDITPTAITVTNITPDCDTSNTILATSRYDTSGGSLAGHDESTNINRAISTSAATWYYAYWKAWDDSSNVTNYIDNEDSVYVYVPVSVITTGSGTITIGNGAMQ